jgi:hypothetical protein
MRKFYQNYIENNLFFWIFSVVSLVLIIAGFIVPPLGTIDNSVLIAAGEINGTIALGCVLRAIDNGVDATFQHNNTSVTITNKDEDGEKDGDK